MRTVREVSPYRFYGILPKRGENRKTYHSRDDVLAESENLGNYAVSTDFR